MADPTPAPDTTVPDPLPDPDQERRAMLRELTQMGMRVARVMEQQALGEETAAPKVADPVLALERMTKMVRMNLALQARLDGLIRTREQKPHAIRIWRAALKGFPPPKEKPETAHRIVEKLIETEADPDEIAELVTEIARAVGALRDPNQPRGLSEETIRTIKARILGIRDDDDDTAPPSYPFKPHPWAMGAERPGPSETPPDPAPASEAPTRPSGSDFPLPPTPRDHPPATRPDPVRTRSGYD